MGMLQWCFDSIVSHEDVRGRGKSLADIGVGAWRLTGGYSTQGLHSCLQLGHVAGRVCDLVPTRCEKFTREAQVGAIHQLSRSALQVVFHSCAYSQEDQWQGIHPVVWLWLCL